MQTVDVEYLGPGVFSLTIDGIFMGLFASGKHAEEWAGDYLKCTQGHPV